MNAYHVTDSQNLRNILANGLIPSKGERSTDFGETEDAVYFFPSEEAVKDALMGWLGDEMEDVDEISILLVDLTGFEVTQTTGYELTVNQTVPPDRIKFVYSEDDFS